jgi:hypothetical protein
MILSDLFAMLSYGELSNLAMAGEANGTITTAAQPRIVLYANEALLRLHSRFLLNEASLILQMYESKTFYQLIPAFSYAYAPPLGTPSEPVRYIMDTPADPFPGDVIKILTVFDSTGEKLFLNDDAQPFSVFTPQPHTLQVPHPKFRCQRYLSVTYQAKHPKLSGDLQEAIDLPDIIIGAFTSFIAYKVFSHMNTQESSAKAQEFLTMYESICSEATEKDLVNSSISTSNQRFSERGWI